VIERDHAPMFAPVFVVRLRPQFGDGVRGLRQFLKTSLRLYGLRCVGATTEEFEVPSPRPSRRTRCFSRFGKSKEEESIIMDKNDLEKLKNYAATTRSPLVFGGCAFIKWDYKNGKYLIGKNATDITGKKLVADVGNAMGGFQRLEAGKKPEYALVKVLGTVEPIERAELGDNNPKQWLDAEKDPWVPVTVMPFFDQDTRQVFILVAAYGGRSETGGLIHAFVDQHPEAADQLPIVQLGAREYIKSDGSVGYAMQLDIVGWAERPAAVLNVQPPPLMITAEAGNGKAASESAASPDKKAAKPQRKISLPGKPDMDQEIPF
jgi:hypothetical protein